MEEWKEYRLGDIATIKGGKRLPKGVNLIKAPNNHPYIRVQDLGHEKTLELNSSYAYVDDETQKFISKYIVNTGDIIMSIVGTIGLIGIVGNTLNNANLTENCVKVVNVSNIEKEYLYYFLISTYGQSEISKGIVGAVQLKLPIKNIQNISIKAPNLIIQKKISNILQSLDEKIELNHCINKNLEQQAHALFKSWFVDFEPFKDGKFVDSELGMIPEGWEVGILDEVGEIVGGGTPSKSEPLFYCDNGISWITPKDLSINQSKYISKGKIDITEIGYKNSSAKKIPAGSVLFSSRAPIGYIAIARNEVTTNQGFKSVIPQKAGTCFIYLFLKYNTEYIESQATGSTFKEVSGSLMKSQKLIIPTQYILDEFEYKLRPIFSAQCNLESENQRLIQIRDTLLPKLMSGELKLGKIETKLNE